MATPFPFIIIKGKPEALLLDQFMMSQNGVYVVKFKSFPTIFHLLPRDVVWLKESVWHDAQHCKVTLSGKELHNIEDIRSFADGEKTHWRLTFSNGVVSDFLHGALAVEESCLSEKQAGNVVAYLRTVAEVNALGKEEGKKGLLSSLYDKITFLNQRLVVVPYLNPAKHKVMMWEAGTLIYPFGCNGSQMKAVTTAFESQISVIQGPPGTGKTQTILNIIANLLMRGKTVLVVSNNNSATRNVQEKLQRYDLAFVVAALGSNDNIDTFIQHQPMLPPSLHDWALNEAERIEKTYEVETCATLLKSVFALQEEQASLSLEEKDVAVEWEHFKAQHTTSVDFVSRHKTVSSQSLLSLWLYVQTCGEHREMAKGWIARLKAYCQWQWLRWQCKYRLHLPFDRDDLQPTIYALQAWYYQVRTAEIRQRLGVIKQALAQQNAVSLNQQLTDVSLALLKDALYRKYHEKEWLVFADRQQLKRQSYDVLAQYPVVLSTTFASKTCLADTVTYDYLIMDEASQVSVETGVLAMTCARQAVIVGDNLQLPNVLTHDDRQKLDAIFRQYTLDEGYNSAHNSFLQSVCAVLPSVPQTLLREHYRCHPKIINFCNQRFYSGNLLIMTEDKGEPNVLQAILTVPGEHKRGFYNQREIDVVQQEVLSGCNNVEEVGIITPYNAQVNAFQEQLPAVETATVHKFQGREKDTIIMSTVDDQISSFSDDANLLNVAVSRAKRRFCLVTSGNTQKLQGHIHDLIGYIAYHNFSVTESKISSVFDYLYSHYTAERLAYLSTIERVSAYDSENLTYKLLTDLLSEYPVFSHLGVVCHLPLRTILADMSLLNDEERRYISHLTTHLDFLVYNRVTKNPVLAVETDGYRYHQADTVQHQRDVMKDHILTLYELPLLRLPTTGSGEHDKIVSRLQQLLHINI